MMKMFSNSFVKTTAVFLAIEILISSIAPTVSYALTSGPTTPEVSSFEPATTTEMVDLATGDFTYNIPLFELPGPNGGYPFNLHYNANITPDQEASWVGLGWNLNPGAINRQLRGLPDEFNGDKNGTPENSEDDDKVSIKQSIKPNVTVGATDGVSTEIYGADFKLGLGLSASLTRSYNNYKGLGYSWDFGSSPAINAVNDQSFAGSLGLKIGLDNDDGVTSEASLSLARVGTKNLQQFTIGLGVNSRAGLTNLSLDLEGARKDDIVKEGKDADGKAINMYSTIGTRGGASLSYARGGYIPSANMAMATRSFNITAEAGPDFVGIDAHWFTTGFFSTTYVKDDAKEYENLAYGYNNLQNASSYAENVLTDFNREQEGSIRYSTPVLPIPVATNDIYTVFAQGLGGSFRSYRNTCSKLREPVVISDNVGVGLGLEIGVGGIVKTGFNGSVAVGKSESGPWTGYDGNSFLNAVNSPTNTNFENYYFKSFGEMTTDFTSELEEKIYGVKPVRAKLNGFNLDNLIQPGTPTSFPNYFISEEVREKRNQYLGYINNDPKNGMMAIQANGLRYFYDTVLYNNSSREVISSINTPSNIYVSTIEVPDDYKINGTNEFYKETNVSKYAYTYLLSQVLGADYVDLTGNGPSDDDLGYWVKFAYSTTQEFGWRAPFSHGSYNKGMESSDEDDVVTFMAGSKEVKFLTVVETKTHKAVFTLSDRCDAIGTNKAITKAGGIDNTAFQKKLDKIQLFSKKDLSVPIKTMEFVYDYSLCKGIPNYDGSKEHTLDGTSLTNAQKGGKLTLKSLKISYKNNSRAALNPYVFSYDENNSASNPNYNEQMALLNVDRWGNYRTSQFANDATKLAFPYTEQYDYSNPANSSLRDKIDSQSASWSLKKIQLPSGGEISVTYEADDYAYVQDKKAGIMVPISFVGNEKEKEQIGNIQNNNKIDVSKNIDDNSLRIYFPLNKEIDDTEEAKANALVAKYCSGLNYLYYKVHSTLRKMGLGKDYKDELTGYAKIKLNGYGVDPNCIVNGKYRYGFVQLEFNSYKKDNGNTKEIKYHPFAHAAWQFIKLNNPKIISSTSNISLPENPGANGAVKQVMNLFSLPLNDLASMLYGYHKMCSDRKWGSEITLDQSFIRLNAPEEKIGGGIRVKRIEFNDNWQKATKDSPTDSETESDSYYGQVYEYKGLIKATGDGLEFESSGVASYEPQVGGDEISLKQPVIYAETIPFSTDSRLFTEEPYNESYFPSASVVYSRVTVKSLASHYKGTSQLPYNFPSGILTTGSVVNEFYTAKEFPVLSYKSEVEYNKQNLPIPIPTIGMMSSKLLSITQGYSIVTNDMHGKPKKISTFDQNTNPYTGTPLSYVHYEYKTKMVENQKGKLVKSLDNKVEVLVSDVNGHVIKDTMHLGVDYEMYTDMRHSKDAFTRVGVDLNVNVSFIVIPIATAVPWPSLDYSNSHLRMSVINKIISKCGILDKVIASDGQSKVVTQNMLFDDKTGNVVLSKVTNNFDDPIYNYSLPAHHAYSKTGHAFQNMNFRFNAQLINQNAVSKLYQLVLQDANSLNYLSEGDELMVGVSKVRIEKINSTGVWCSATAPVTSFSAFMVVRSGYRNNLEATVSEIKTLGKKDDENYGNPTNR